jgi:rhamnosyltransferase
MTAPVTPRASVIVRTKDKAGTVEATFAALRAQTVAAEIVVVDSGSTDGTLAIARRHADRIVEIPPESFTFGRALNVGARAASAPIHFALSAHCRPDRDDWIERALRHYERPEVAATNGQLWRWDGRPLVEPVDQTAEILRAAPGWGFSNHAASWRASVWDDVPFDEAMEACEDKEWAARVVARGGVVVVDPVLHVEGAHRKAHGARALFHRTRREARAMAAAGLVPAFPARAAVHEWWADLPSESMSPALFHRINWLRMADIAGRCVGDREGRRRRPADDGGGGTGRPLPEPS